MNLFRSLWETNPVFRILFPITITCLLTGALFAGYVGIRMVSSSVEEVVRNGTKAP